MSEDFRLPDATRQLLALREPADAPSPEHVRWVFETYCNRLSTGDVDGIMELFADDAEFQDPAGTPARRGRAEIREFFEMAAGSPEMKGLITLELSGPVRISGAVAAAPMISKAPGLDPPMLTETLDVLWFDSAGRITNFLAIWGETNLRPLDQA